MPERSSSKVWKIVSAWIVVLLYLTLAGTVFAGDLELNKVKSAIRERRARWVAGETSVSKLPEEEKLKRVGLIKPEIVEFNRLKAIPDYAGLDAVALPAVFDWRKQGI
ncbi:MAG: hypothetical protein HGA63_08150, partial [Syntrophobacteraceae bacterium]|nr:hypothetical protein [Syntrophobacteraceae bacterium]